MTESQNGQQKNEDALSALEAMAAGEDPTAAQQPQQDGAPPPDTQEELARLAEGGTPAAGEGDEAPPEGEPPAEAGDDFAALAAASTAPGGAIDDIPVTESAPGARKARAANAQSRARAVHAHHFKKTMVPLLLTVGILLFVLGAAMLVVLLTPDGERNLIKRTENVMRYGKWLVVAAFPLGAILLVGAWLFWTDVKKSQDT